MKFGLNRNDSGIYMIKNLLNGKVYIGSALHLSDRLSNHFHLLETNKHHSTHLQNTWNLNSDYFICGVIEFVNDKTQLTTIEQKYIDKYSSANDKYGYNICPIAGSNLGCKLTRGLVERSEKMKGSGNNFYNKKHTEESLKLILESNIFKTLSNKNIDEIKRLWNSGEYKQHELAKMFNVGQPYVSKIVNNIRRTKNY